MALTYAQGQQFFQDEIDLVDVTKTLVFDPTPEPGYSFHEWSYDGLTIKAGSERALEQGAHALLTAMGFKWYAPFSNGAVIPAIRPVSIPTNLTAPKQTFNITEASLQVSHGVGSFVAVAPWQNDRTDLEDSYDRYAILNCVSGDRQNNSAGHIWQGIISRNQAYFDANPQLLDDVNPETFDLSVTGQDRANLVMICAADSIDQGFNDENRRTFEPTDTTNHTTEEVVSLTKDVCIQIRAGTSAIGTHGAYAGVPGVKLNILAYRDHGVPPIDDYSEWLHVTVTDGFQFSGMSTNDIVAGWIPKAASVTVYYYVDLPSFDDCMPINVKSDWYSNRVESAVALGATGVNFECGINWLNTLILYRQLVVHARDGTGTYASALAEAKTDVFADDAAVENLYNLWYSDGKYFNKYDLATSFGYVDDMAAGWYKTAFQQYHCVVNGWRLHRRLKLDHPTYPWLGVPGLTTKIQDTNDGGYVAATDPVPASIDTVQGWAFALRMEQIFHTYGFERATTNAVLIRDHYLDQYFHKNLSVPDVYPNWMYEPFAVKPTATDFANAKQLIDREVARPTATVLDSEDLVLVTGITPLESGVEQTGFELNRSNPEEVPRMRFKFVALSGGGSVTRSDTDGSNPVVTNYAEGMHEFFDSGIVLLTPSNGYLFCSWFPAGEMGNVVDDYWVYAPKSADGQVRMRTTGAAYMNYPDQTVIGPDDGEGPFDWPTGHIRYRGLGIGVHSLVNVNKWVSLKQDIALMPRAMAEADFQNYVQMKLV